VQKDFGEVRSVVFDPKGEPLASGGTDGKVRIWNLSHPDKFVALPSGPGGGASPIVSLAFNADGTKLAVGRRDRTISVSDLREPQRLIQDRTIFVGSIDAGEDMLDTCIA
jgi:eukaryotic-like serine/threonine-protein kinase